jgi:hypothetical protein
LRAEAGKEPNLDLSIEGWIEFPETSGRTCEAFLKDGCGGAKESKFSDEAYRPIRSRADVV